MSKADGLMRLLDGMNALMKDAEQVVGAMPEEALIRVRESFRSPDGRWCCVWCAELDDESVVAKVVLIGSKQDCDECTKQFDLKIPAGRTVAKEFHSVVPARDWLQMHGEQI